MYRCWCSRSSPGTAATSLSRVKSSSRVGGWCCRGQLDTAAVSCSNSKIHTWIKPAGHGVVLSRIHRGERTELSGKFPFTCVIIELLQDAVDAVLAADGALM